MNPKKGLIARLLFPLAVMAVGSACFLEGIGGPAATSQMIYVTATPENGGSEGRTPSSTIESILDLTATWTLTPEPTHTATAALLTMTAGQALSCVKGPHYILYEWVAGIAEGETVTLLARSTADWPDYYYVRKSNGTECWAFGGSSTISGNASGLPEREAPPLPEVHYAIANQTLLAVTSVKIRQMDSSDWGANRLGAPIAPGTTSSLTLTVGFYDILIQDGWGGKLYEKYDTPIGSDPNYRNVALDAEFEFYLQNNFAADVCVIKVKPAGGSSWQVLNNAADNITPGNRITFKLLPGIYAVQVYRCVTVLLVNWPDKYFGPAVAGYNVP